MIILSIETSCDDTAAAVVSCEKNEIRPLSSYVSSQIKLHSKWGGVVPNLAAREHLKNIIPVVNKTLENSGISKKEIDLIAVTNGPGLIPALLIGTTAAKTLSYLWKKPLIGIHHIEGHIYANFIGDKIGSISNSQFIISKRFQNSKFKIQNSSIRFPVLCLVVSGGHTQLVLMKKHLDYEIIGETLDDAAGEAFDKVARILGLGYPGGPAISAMADKFQIQNLKKIQDTRYEIRDTKLPRPMINSKDFNFSFSGLKTAVLYETKKNKDKLKSKRYISMICYEFQKAVVDVLIAKTIQASKKYKPKTIMLAGGVSANQELRKKLQMKIEKELPDTRYQIPDTKYSLDNAAMIAAAASMRWEKNKSNIKFMNLVKDNWENLQTEANLKLS